jgi:hypothetical protein
MFRTLLITMALVAMACYLGCKDTGDPISVSPPDDAPLMTKDDSVIANCYLLRDALDAYAAANGGLVPGSNLDELPDGRTLYDFLPGGLRLLNPYSGVRTDPIDAPARSPGETGWRVSGPLPLPGYIINGIGGERGTEIFFIERESNQW